MLREYNGVSPLAFYSLSLKQEQPSKLLSEDDRNSWKVGAPFLYLDFLAVLRSEQGFGLGQLLLSSIMQQTLELCKIAPVYGLALKTLNERTEQYYAKLGFKEAPGEAKNQNKLMVLPLQAIRSLFS